MKPRDRAKHKGRKVQGGFTLIPHAVQDGPNWRACGGSAIKLLCDLARQYRGSNNGDLCASMSMLKPKGWTSPETVNYALRELRHYGLIVQTRQGGLHAASLYALTWHAIDECGGKLDCAATTVAPCSWRDAPATPFKRPKKNRKASTDSVTVATESVPKRRKRQLVSYGIRT
ncbi:hypothetical protein [Rhodanobacter sp. Soil772]|uniref:hypothetical protein n=1 Tax=Rhodanobacter sp. Soil772 TaxID=1736406 RepID=UPI000A8521D9|nr:hypothetical protein [Rhodanobacter sp. Soil772]